jgi:endogenous inhibitor of DNA gyrase (YacG/DUF329 family)
MAEAGSAAFRQVQFAAVGPASEPILRQSMSASRLRTEVLNPCPTCGKHFDVGGCMTFVDYFLETLHGGKCPACGTQVVIRVQERFRPEVWESATTLPEIRAVVIDNLDLSVRTRRSLEQLGLVTIGDVLDTTEARIRQGLPVADPVIAEIRRLLATKGLAVASA